MTNNLYISLSHRTAIKIAGNDARSFLQGLISNDINKLDTDDSIYTLMLTPQGKFLYDFFIIKYEDFYLLDCNKDSKEQIIKKLSMYKLRSDVTIADLSSVYKIVTYIVDSIQDINRQVKKIAYKDPRLSSLIRSFSLIENNDEAVCDEGFSIGTIEDYNMLRIKNLIAEGHIDMISENAFPHDFNMNEVGAIDYKKGCYVGQEVTTRVYHRGKIRNKLTLLEKNHEDIFPKIGSSITQNNKNVGILLSSVKNTALAMLNQEMIEKTNNEYNIDKLKLVTRS
jgi:folate-binding protein YgfZ